VIELRMRQRHEVLLQLQKLQQVRARGKGLLVHGQI
jgi:hypothetical protein